MKKILSLILCIVLFALVFTGCNDKPASSSSSTPVEKETIEATVKPIVYASDVIKKAEETTAGSVEDWANQRSVYGTAPDSVIVSPFHTLKINGEEVPVYTARTRRGMHSFAWVDIEKTRKEWHINVELTTTEAYAKCVVLPESTGVEVISAVRF